jgi:hypothetical protein
MSLDDLSENATSSSYGDGDAEQLELPAHYSDGDFGGENCKCRCHVNVVKAEEGSHCLHCSLVVSFRHRLLFDLKLILM